jgi:hypothetical protein
MRAGGGIRVGALAAALLAASGCSFGQSDTETCKLGLATAVAGDEQGINSSTLGTGPARGLAQSFKLTEDLTINAVQVQLKAKVPTGSTLTGTVTLSLYGDSLNNVNGTPADPGTILSSGATGNMLASQVSSTETTWYNFPFTSAVALSANVNYWIVMEATYPATDPSDPVNAAIVMWIGNAQNAFAQGQAEFKSSSGTLWNGFTGNNLDLLFRIGCT